MSATDWPYEVDGVLLDDPMNRYRFPIVATVNSRWSYISAVMVADPFFGGLRPTETELTVIASWHEEYVTRWYTDSYRARMRNRPFDIDDGANGRLLIKYAQGSWGYRYRSWTGGPFFAPPRNQEPPLSLLAVLDRESGGGPGHICQCPVGGLESRARGDFRDGGVVMSEHDWIKPREPAQTVDDLHRDISATLEELIALRTDATRLHARSAGAEIGVAYDRLATARALLTITETDSGL